MFTEELEKVQLQLVEAQKQAHAAERAKDVVGGELRAAKTRCQELESAVAERDGEVASLKTRLRDATAKAASFQETEARMARAESDLQVLHKKTAGLTADLLAAKEELADTAARLASANQTVDERNKELAVTQQVMSALKERVWLDGVIERGVTSLPTVPLTDKQVG